MKYDTKKISDLRDDNLSLAKAKLMELPIFCGREPSIPALHGWVYEQTILFCLREELRDQELTLEWEEQVSFTGRAKADFRIGHSLIEVKTSGLFGKGDVERYRKYGEQAESKGYRYLFVTAYESHGPYRRGIIDALERSSVFILDQPGEWERLVRTIAEELRMKEDPSS